MNINVIVGAPCAGKSTYIVANSNDDDVLVDYDKLAIAIGASKPHSADGSIRLIALRLRHSAITKIISGIDHDAWIIHTSPCNTLINDYIDAGAKFTILDPGEETCKERAEADERPDGTIEAIEKWYKSPPEIPEEHIANSLITATKLLRAQLYAMSTGI